MCQWSFATSCERFNLVVDACFFLVYPIEVGSTWPVTNLCGTIGLLSIEMNLFDVVVTQQFITMHFFSHDAFKSTTRRWWEYFENI